MARPVRRGPHPAWLRRVAVAVLLLALVGPAVPAVAAPPDDPTRPTPPVDGAGDASSPAEEGAGAGADPVPLLDDPDLALVRDLITANRDLDALDTRISGATTRAEALRRERATVQSDVEATEASITDATTQIAVLEAELRDRLARTYMADGATGEGLGLGLDPAVDEGVIRRIYAEARTQTDERIAERLEDQREALRDRRAELGDLRDDLADQRTQLDDLLASLRAQRADRAEAALLLQARVEEALRRARLEAAARARDAAALEELAGVVVPTDQDADPGPGGVLSDEVAPGGLALCTVGGITVSCLIAGDLGRMLLTAAADGLTLTGGGYRSLEEQVALRAAHCGGDVYGASSGACSPPTARPGSSLHEFGLAVDFDQCSTRSTPCWQWLDQHAAEFGFTNLPSEPWHWSITGG
ncbi:D-alanyl-D-alanine carboxypeptidase family protein [Iamia majanohamensis]|uniref:D-alanyl-D-alanine carboxypeptidase family protein n=1 Tax=Iamia majanohamensis TaxID=467976 RepID=A0AAF0BVI5_9ACTN|nr:D-alanyl-D-alanine carboxypeptidase family protein [Iamia majanohamensis]WCO66805.1 D-alanyl-D-alanine carboxypeptidase family protein [Iamia majanohamensis]